MFLFTACHLFADTPSMFNAPPTPLMFSSAISTLVPVIASDATLLRIAILLSVPIKTLICCLFVAAYALISPNNVLFEPYTNTDSLIPALPISCMRLSLSTTSLLNPVKRAFWSILSVSMFTASESCPSIENFFDVVVMVMPDIFWAVPALVSTTTPSASLPKTLTKEALLLTNLTSKVPSDDLPDTLTTDSSRIPLSPKAFCTSVSKVLPSPANLRFMFIASPFLIVFDSSMP